MTLWFGLWLISLSIFESFSLFSWLGKVLFVITSLIPPLGHFSFVWVTFPPSLGHLHGAVCWAAGEGCGSLKPD